MATALAQAKRGRVHILDRMAETLAAPREELSPYAPRMIRIQIPKEKIRDVIGPGGKIIRGIEEETGADVNVEDDGTIYVSSPDAKAVERAIEIIRQLTADVEVGKTYTGKVVRVMDFGAFVQVLPGKDGLCHISELDFGRVEKVEDICREGDELVVKCIDIDGTGRVRLSRREALIDQGVQPPPRSHDRRDGARDGDEGDDDDREPRGEGRRDSRRDDSRGGGREPGRGGRSRRGGPRR